MLEEAIALAVEAHKGQRDKYGAPYILHPLRVMLRLQGETDQIVGILHDVVEDSEITFEQLAQMGYSAEVIAALDGVTRRENESYSEFIERSLQNATSRGVKLADLEDNMNIRRLPVEFSERDCERLQRYRRAWQVLSGERG